MKKTTGDELIALAAWLEKQSHHNERVHGDAWATLERASDIVAAAAGFLLRSESTDAKLPDEVGQANDSP